jgi:Fic family protein
MAYKYSFTPEIVKYLQTIERARAEVTLTVLPPATAEGLRLRARVRSTQFSTRIEGNRVTLAEAEQVLLEGKNFPGRERDTLEVQHYFKALAQVETWVEKDKPITEKRIRQLHADSGGGIVYLPPEAADVSALMQELTEWIQQSEGNLPVPVIAGIAHYQFVTIHPYFDGNGRTARALATWILYRGKYDLGRFYALEEFYAQDLQGYYNALETSTDHNYYYGRAEADITPWLAYFLKGMAAVFDTVAQEIREKSLVPDEKTERLLRKLDRRARMALGLFSRQDEITANDVARVLGLSARQARSVINEWLEEGWLEVSDPSRKTRKYRLSAEYRRFIG